MGHHVKYRPQGSVNSHPYTPVKLQYCYFEGGINTYFEISRVLCF